MHIPNDVAFTIGFFVVFLYGKILESPQGALLIAFIIAIAKEINDQDVYNEYDWINTVAVMCGATVAYMILTVLAVL